MKLKIKLLDQYIWQQLIYLFIGTVVLLASLAVTLGTVSDLTYKISEYNLPLLVAVQIFFLKVPEYTAYALPIALLLTTLLVYGRLNNDSELIGFYSTGIGIYSLVTPAILFSILITGTTFILNEFIVPPANYTVAELESIFISKSKSPIQQKDIFYPEYKTLNNKSKLKRLYYAQNFDGDKFKNIMILDWVQSHPQKIIEAQQAIWNRKQRTWQLFKGKIETLEFSQSPSIISDSTNNTTSAQVDFFEQKTLFLPATFFEFANQTREPQQMSLREAIKYLELIINSHDEAKIRLLKVRIQQKLAFPFICIVFTVIGSSIAINFNQINRGKGFGLCVAIVFIYYFLGFIIGSCGIVGLVSPMVAGWLPNLVGWGTGGWLFYGNNR